MNNRLHTYEPVCKDPLGHFEMERDKAHKKQMAIEIRDEIEKRDEAIFDVAERICPDCGGVLHSHGRTGAIKYFALCGEVAVRLRRMRCVSCQKIIVPSRELLPEESVSAALAERMCDLASKMPYAKATDSLEIQHGITMSTKKFWKHVQQESEKIGDALADEAKCLYETGEIPECVDLKGEKPLIVGIDGGWVRGWKDSPSFEVKCATIATGVAAGPGRERRLTDRVGYASQCSISDFRQRISTLAIKSGYLTASQKIFVSDGATWIANMIDEYFPDAVHVLDMYHLKNKIQTLFGIKAEGKDAELRDNALSVCDSYEPTLILDSLLLWQPEVATKVDALKDLVGYIENNANAIRNHALVHIHGSGWIEKGVDLMISRRMKNRGMAWSTAGSSHIIPFAVLRYNKQWGVYWNKRKGIDLASA